MIFDGSTYKARTGGSMAGHKGGGRGSDYKFIEARDQSLLNQLADRRKKQPSTRTITIFKELANEIDISYQSIERIVAATGVMSSLRPISNQSINPIQSTSKDFRTCAWS